jgi:hypothetical protein
MLDGHRLSQEIYKYVLWKKKFMFVSTVFYLKTAQFMLDKHDSIVESYNTSAIRKHFDKNVNINLFTVT